MNKKNVLRFPFIYSTMIIQPFQIGPHWSCYEQSLYTSPKDVKTQAFFLTEIVYEKTVFSYA